MNPTTPDPLLRVGLEIYVAIDPPAVVVLADDKVFTATRAAWGLAQSGLDGVGIIRNAYVAVFGDDVDDCDVYYDEIPAWIPRPPRRWLDILAELADRVEVTR